MNKYAVLIGNSQFPDESDKSKLPDLACPVQDVDGLGKVLASERGEFDVLALKNKPSYKILRELQRKLKQATSDDLFLLYYSGHGKPNKSNILHLTTFDTVVAELATSAISMNRIYEILSEAKCRKIVIILDCCYSGAAGQGFKGAVDDQLQQLNNARGTYLVTASTELQVAHESAAEGLSLFTKHLIAGLETGEADKDGDGLVTMDELYDYVQGKVIAENPNQQPTKHVKEERGCSFPIAKSGHNSREEQDEKIRNKLLDLSRQDEEFVEILTEAMKLAKLQTKQFSALQHQQYELLKKLVAVNLKPITFIRNWDELNHPILTLSPEPKTLLVEKQKPIKIVEQPLESALPIPQIKKKIIHIKGIILIVLVIIGVSSFGIWKVVGNKATDILVIPKVVQETPTVPPIEDKFAEYIKQRDKQQKDMQAAANEGIRDGFHLGGEDAKKEQAEIDVLGNDKTKQQAAVVYLTELANANDADAMRLLGLSYYRNKNYKEGCLWYKKASENGNQKAKAMYEKAKYCR